MGRSGTPELVVQMEVRAYTRSAELECLLAKESQPKILEVATGAIYKGASRFTPEFGRINRVALRMRSREV